MWSVNVSCFRVRNYDQRVAMNANGNLSLANRLLPTSDLAFFQRSTAATSASWCPRVAHWLPVAILNHSKFIPAQWQL